MCGMWDVTPTGDSVLQPFAVHASDTECPRFPSVDGQIQPRLPGDACQVGAVPAQGLRASDNRAASGRALDVGEASGHYPANKEAGALGHGSPQSASIARRPAAYLTQDCRNRLTCKRLYRTPED